MHYPTAIARELSTEISSLQVSVIAALVIINIPFIQLSKKGYNSRPNVSISTLSDILLSDKGQLKLGDFGLARAFDPASKDSLSHQVSGFFLHSFSVHIT